MLLWKGYQQLPSINEGVSTYQPKMLYMAPNMMGPTIEW